MTKFMKPTDLRRRAAHHSPGRANVRRQRGIVLAVALMLLVVITLIGLAAVRTTTMQQRMTANFYDRALAFQSAEHALQAGAQTVTNGKGVIARLCAPGGRACQGEQFA